MLISDFPFVHHDQTLEELESISHGPTSQNVVFPWCQGPPSTPKRDIFPLRARSNESFFGISGRQIQAQGWFNGQCRGWGNLSWELPKSSLPSLPPLQSAPAEPNWNLTKWKWTKTSTIPGSSGVLLSRKGENFTLDIVHVSQEICSVSRYFSSFYL